IAGPAAGDERFITGYVGSTKTATVDSNWSETPTSASRFVLNFSMKNAKSVDINGTANANISTISQNAGGNTFVSEPSFSSLVLRFPTSFIKDSLQINNSQYKRVYSGVSYTTNLAVITADSGEAFVGTG